MAFSKRLQDCREFIIFYIPLHPYQNVVPSQRRTATRWLCPYHRHIIIVGAQAAYDGSPVQI